MSKRIRIIHLINSLTHGGAEAMLCSVLQRTDRERFDPSVAVLIDDLTVAGPIRAASIPITVIGMKSGVPDARGVWRLAHHFRRERPDVVQTWMDHSNLVGGISSWLGARTRLVWGIHHSDHAPGISKRMTRVTVSACATLSHRLPARIVYCSEEARRWYELHGFSRHRSLVIPNGFDTGRFKPDPSAQVEVRKELGLSPQAILVGLVARYDPVKDHKNFLEAASLLAARMPDVQFVMCGDKVDRHNAVLMSLVSQVGLTNRCHLLGPRSDVARINAALDVATSASRSEAFPLVLGEAMACGVPCVATDVGDSALIVGNTGWIVPAGNSAALADGWVALLSMPPAQRAELGWACRNRISVHFDLAVVCQRYERLYLDVLGDGRPAVGAEADGLKIPAAPSVETRQAATEARCR